MYTTAVRSIEWLCEHFRLVEALGLVLLLGSWSFNWWSTEDWSDAATSLRDKYDLIERTAMTAQTFNVIRFEGSVIREAATVTPRPNASYGELMNAVWRSGEVRQLRVTMAGLKVHCFEIFLSEISPLVSSYAANLYPKLVDAQAQLGKLRSRLHEIMPAEVDLPMTHAPVPNEQQFTLQAAEQLESSVMSAVAAALELRQEIAKHLGEQKRLRTIVASMTFLFGSLLVSFAKLVEWKMDRKHKGSSDSVLTTNPPAKTKRIGKVR